MRKRSQIVFILAIAVLGVWFVTSTLASQSSSERFSQEASGAPGIGTRPQTPDDLMVEVANVVPGFADLYFEGDVLNVVLTRPSPEAARQAAALYFRNDDRLDRAREIRAVQGQYDGKQLKAWRDAVATISIEGISARGIAVKENRLRIDVKDHAARDRVLAALAQLNIPQEAVLINVGLTWHASFDQHTSLEASGAPGIGTRPQTPDDLMVEVANVVPGFAGLYFEGDVLNVVLTHPSPEAARQAAGLYFRNDDRLDRAREIRAVQGQYDGRQLKAWRDAVATFPMKGISGWGIGIKENRLRIDVEDDAARDRVLAALAQSNIPAEAVLINVGVKVSLS